MEDKTYRIRLAFQGAGPGFAIPPKEVQVSAQSRPMDLLPDDLPSYIELLDLEFNLDGKEIPPDTAFANTPVRDGSLLQIIDWFLHGPQRHPLHGGAVRLPQRRRVGRAGAGVHGTGVSGI